MTLNLKLTQHSKMTLNTLMSRKPKMTQNAKMTQNQKFTENASKFGLQFMRSLIQSLKFFSTKLLKLG